MKVVKENTVLVVGEADEIKAVWKSMYRAWVKDRSNIWPSHTSAPKFREGGVYSISIEPQTWHDVFYVCGPDTTLRMLLS